MKILFYQRTDVIESAGGTEKVLCFLSSSLAKRGYDVVFMTNEKKEGKLFFSLYDKVKFVNIGGTLFTGFRKFIFKLIKSTPILKLMPFFNNYKYTSDVAYKYIKEEKPDLIILANPQDLMEICYSHTYKSPIVQMVHNVPWNIFHRKSKTVLKITLDLMKNVNVCQVLMHSFVGLMKPYYNGKVVVIPNSVPSVDDKFICDYSDKKDKFKIINIARITPVKNQELLIKAFAKIHTKNPKWEIHLWGNEDKKYKEKLDLLVKEFGLQNKVFFKGKTKQPLEELKNSDIFAFPSHFEGFGLSLGEAMACGLSSIGLKKAPAVNELIVDGQNGILTDENIDIFAQDLEILMSSVLLRKKMGKKAKEMIKDYSEEKIVNMWDKLIKDLL
ncbi:MAG TPA: glycosyltransferase [Rickettsiales bacterium]|nr:glycosyltransferase [Rickettsiales bacterium]